ncbi:prephenate dehydratase [Paraglaciecola hydrolytica]|uniref:prephenate dehydratase n=1 Tax=Paraglaciecola hydrolytica TaxID=1799789 RepID=A0A136A6I1_9ALTE|nr:prephenate dehydratase [Paraglaciecola hydrolytica]KXI30839.1 prephenate dehydratase [Paraglaciecola hydrolytica]
MKKIATLGPKGTFSDTASQKYIAAQNLSHEIEYFDSIKLALNAVGHSCEIGILPVENFSEGFISLVLDHLLDADLFIMAEIRLPIRFSLVSNSRLKQDIKHLFVQFVAKGQCSEFIGSLHNVEVESTESNIESLVHVQQGQGNYAAIVPSNAVQFGDFPLVLEDINDYKNNETRFLVFSKDHTLAAKQANTDYKTSVIVMDENDHPGFLGEVLLSFSSRKINLTSIMSRPTRQTFGKYHFFIDFDGHIEDKVIALALAEIKVNCKVKVLGSYPKLNAQS